MPVSPIHSIPHLPHWHRGRMLVARRRRARAVAVVRAGRLAGDRGRGRARELPARRCRTSTAAFARFEQIRRPRVEQHHPLGGARELEQGGRTGRARGARRRAPARPAARRAQRRPRADLRPPGRVARRLTPGSGGRPLRELQGRLSPEVGSQQLPPRPRRPRAPRAPSGRTARPRRPASGPCARGAGRPPITRRQAGRETSSPVGGRCGVAEVAPGRKCPACRVAATTSWSNAGRSRTPPEAPDPPRCASASAASIHSASAPRPRPPPRPRASAAACRRRPGIIAPTSAARSSRVAGRGR